jgi:hypothetical protein
MAKGRTKEYPTLPIVLVFKTSNRSNAKIKMKVFNNKNVDEVNDEYAKLPGVPDIAEFLALGVGKSFVERFKKEFNISL